jgi:molybdate transport repressor ModE-like protein
MHGDDARIFLAVAREGSFSSAAKRLGVQHSTVSRRIHALKKQLASPLVERKATGYVLTDAGEELKQSALRIEKELLAFEGLAGGQSDDIAGELRITAIANMASTVLMPYFAKFSATYPKIELSVQVTNNSVRLSDREADIAIRQTSKPHLPMRGTRLSTYLINKAGFKISQAHTGAVTLIQRFGSALNLNLHFHVLFIDGVFSPKSNGNLRFHWVNAPTSKELNALVATISERVARYLERQGWLARDEQSDNLTLTLDDEEGNTMQQLQGHSITYRIAMGPQAGRKVLTLQTIPAREEEYGTEQLGRIGGFSLHAGVSVNTRERKKLERICRCGPAGRFPVPHYRRRGWS